MSVSQGLNIRTPSGVLDAAGFGDVGDGGQAVAGVFEVAAGDSIY
ncbi:hypothetical protein AB0N05_19700 [Nocardia sp. NPDC051030]